MASMVGMMVGQCGNQIGAAAYGALHAERPLPGERALFDEGGHARAVLVDGEAKVIGALVREAGGPFSRANAFAEDSGRGNNWALGYYGPRAGNRIVDSAMEALRRQLEASDAYRGGMIFHSLCGGTGAGLGSRIMEEMRDELAASPLVSTTVLPFSVGELPLQHYNATLCLSRVIKEAAACLLFSNNDLLCLCAKRNASKPGCTTVRPADAAAATVRTKQINDYIGLALASVLRPCVFSRQPRGRTAVPWDMAGSIAALAPTPETKFLEIWAVQESSKRRMGDAPPWASLGDRLAGVSHARLPLRSAPPPPSCMTSMHARTHARTRARAHTHTQYVCHLYACKPDRRNSPLPAPSYLLRCAKSSLGATRCCRCPEPRPQPPLRPFSFVRTTLPRLISPTHTHTHTSPPPHHHHTNNRCLHGEQQSREEKGLRNALAPLAPAPLS